MSMSLYNFKHGMNSHSFLCRWNQDDDEEEEEDRVNKHLDRLIHSVYSNTPYVVLSPGTKINIMYE